MRAKEMSACMAIYTLHLLTQLLGSTMHVSHPHVYNVCYSASLAADLVWFSNFCISESSGLSRSSKKESLSMLPHRRRLLQGRYGESTSYDRWRQRHGDRGYSISQSNV